MHPVYDGGPWNKSFTASANKDDSAASGISAYDAALCLRHLIGAESLSLLQSLACDVDGDGAVRDSDVRQILRRSVGIDETFAAESHCASSWIFEAKPFVGPGTCSRSDPNLGLSGCSNGDFSCSGANFGAA